MKRWREWVSIGSIAKIINEGNNTVVIVRILHQLMDERKWLSPYMGIADKEQNSGILSGNRYSGEILPDYPDI